MKTILHKGFYISKEGTENILINNELFKGRWIYGQYVEIPEEHITTGVYSIYNKIKEDVSSSDFMKYLDNSFIVSRNNGIWYPIVKYSAREFIGKYDKKGTPIFENDILATKYGRLCRVVWFSSGQHCGWDFIPINTLENHKYRAPDVYDIWEEKNLEIIDIDNNIIIKGE